MRVVSRVEGGGKGRAGSVAGTVAQERAVRRTGMRSSTIVGLRDSGEQGFALPEDVRHFSRGDRQTCFSVYLFLSLCSCSSDGVCSHELCSVGAVLVLRWCSVGVVLMQRWCSSPLLDVAALVPQYFSTSVLQYISTSASPYFSTFTAVLQYFGTSVQQYSIAFSSDRL